MAAVDHHSGAVRLIANAINFDNSNNRVDDAYQDCIARLDKMQSDLAASSGLKPLKFIDTEISITNEQTDAQFEASVLKAKEHIFAGDAFQIVLSRKFKVNITAKPIDIYGLCGQLIQVRICIFSTFQLMALPIFKSLVLVQKL